MDRTDAKLIRILAENADIPATELSARVNLSVPAVNKRVARLKASGAIRRVSILTDPEQVGKPIVAFVLVVLEHVSHADTLLEYVQSDEDVLECCAVTGEYDYLLKICAADIKAFEKKLLHLKRSRGVVKSHTMLSLMEQKLAPAALPDIESELKERTSNS